MLLKSSHRLKLIKLETELEALLFEAELIKTHKPKYNVRLKDDKSPIYILFTQEKFPRILIIRKTDISPQTSNKNLFGPYQSAYQTMYLIRSLRKIFPFCNSPQHQKKQKIPCFYYHLNLCPGACTGAISQADYLEIINNFKKFLKGRKRAVLKKLHEQMIRNSQADKFEQAAKYRDQILAVNQLLSKKSFSLRYSQEKSDSFSSRKELWKILAPYISPLQSRLPSDPFSRIEAYDVSNLQGKQATASMVVFELGEPFKKEYRRFRIRLTKEPDDLSMLAEAISRRIKHREWNLPDLMLVDGGKSQVSTAVNILRTKGLHHRLPVIGLAKRNEEIVVKNQSYHIIRLPKSSPALRLLISIRDEAHRFALAYHRKLRDSSYLK